MGEKRVAVVTGGERGIGLGVVERLVREGWRVMVGGLDLKVARALGRFEDEVCFRETDFASESSVQSLMAESLAWGGRIDGLVLNAGIASPRRDPLDTLSLEDWQRVIDVNLTGPFLCAKWAKEALIRSRGAIVAIASTRALMSEPNTFAYTASKGGLVALTHALAVSLGPDVRCNAVSPGWIHTGDPAELSASDHGQHPVGRVGLPDDIAALVAYLLGPDSGFVTGQNFVVDGGMTKKMIYEE